MKIEDRLEQLEKKVKRNNIIMLSVIIFGILTINLGMASRKDEIPEVIKSRAFTVVDKNGNERVNLMVIKDGPVVFLSDENGYSRVRMMVDKNGPSLNLFEPGGMVVWHAPN